jgi:hypothetical protein
MCASKSGWRASCSQPTSRVGSVQVLRVKNEEALGQSGVSLSSAAQARECERFGEDQARRPIGQVHACIHHLPCGNPVPNLMKQLRWRWQQGQAERLIFTALGDAFHHLPLLSALQMCWLPIWASLQQCGETLARSAYSTWKWHAVGSQNTPGGSCMQALRKGNSLEVPPGQGCLHIFLLGKQLLSS